MLCAMGPPATQSEGPLSGLNFENDPSVVVIDYTNYRGERAERRILPDRLWFGAAEWHPDPQWILDAWDVEKQTLRSFALAGVHSWKADSAARG